MDRDTVSYRTKRVVMMILNRHNMNSVNVYVAKEYGLCTVCQHVTDVLLIRINGYDVIGYMLHCRICSTCMTNVRNVALSCKTDHPKLSDMIAIANIDQSRTNSLAVNFCDMCYYITYNWTMMDETAMCVDCSKRLVIYKRIIVHRVLAVLGDVVRQYCLAIYLALLHDAHWCCQLIM